FRMLAPLVLALLQQGQPAQQPQLPPSPVARIEVLPANPSVAAQDTLRLRARALDASGNVVPNATVRFIAAGGRFESVVEPDGLIISGATGQLPVTVVASVPGTRPVTERVEVAMVPGPAARIAFDVAPTRLVVGQQSHFKATAYSAHNDARADRIEWRSSAPRIVCVGNDGLVTALAAGTATLRA